MSIGDALGMPVEGWPRETVQERYGRIETYHPRAFGDGTQLEAGEFTDESEGVLCIVESYTANTGELDADNIRARLEILARGESRRWMNPSTRVLLDEDVESTSTNSVTAAITGDVAVRGIPLGLIAAGSAEPDPLVMRQKAKVLAGLTHQAADAAESVELVAEATRALALQEISLSDVPSHIARVFPNSGVANLLDAASKAVDELENCDSLVGYIGYGDSADEVVASAVVTTAKAESFEDAVFTATSLGGAADARGAIAGAFAGAAFGTAGIPQSLIDGLEGRVYVMLAAPWFYQTIQLRNSFARSSPQE